MRADKHRAEQGNERIGTDELEKNFGAGNETRTRDPDLGKFAGGPE
jgi:hypothetical protein